MEITRYSIDPRTRDYVKGYGFLSFWRNISNKYRKQLLDDAAKTELDALETSNKKLVHKTSEALEELIGNKITEKFIKNYWKLLKNY